MIVNEEVVNLIMEEGVAVAGTLGVLVEKISSPSVVDVDFLQDVLITYRAFISPDQFLQALVERYRNTDSFIVRARVCNCIVNWMDKHWEEIEKENPLVLEKLSNFVESMNTTDNEYKKLRKSLDLLPTGPVRNIALDSAPPPFIPKEKENFLDWKSAEIARQITRIDWEIWKHIRPVELLGYAWPKKNDSRSFKNVVLMLERISSVSNWVTTYISGISKVSERDKTIMKFVDVVKELRKIGNFSSTIAIVNGLYREPVKGYCQTEYFLKKKKQEKLQEINEFFDLKQNFAKLLQITKLADPPRIPYLEIIITELRSIEDRQADFISNLINFKKIRLIADCIKAFLLSQQKGYNYTDVPLISNKIKCHEDDLLRHTKEDEKTIELEPATDWPWIQFDRVVNFRIIPISEELVTTASLLKVIERLTHHIRADSQSLLPFISVHRVFLNSAELLRLIISRYKNIPEPKEKLPENMQKWLTDFKSPIFFRVQRFIKSWIGDFWCDFSEDEEMRSILSSFVDSISGNTALQFREIITAKQEIFGSLIQYRDDLYDGISNVEPGITLLSYGPTSLAEQLTLLTSKMISQILPGDFISQMSSPTILKLLALQFDVEKWLLKEIVECKKQGREISILKQIIEITKELKSLQNWHIIFPFINCISKTTDIFKNAWYFLSNEDKDFLNKEIPSIEGNTESHDFAKIKVPMIPSIKRIMNNILKLQEDLVNHTTSDLIDMAKYRNIGNIIISVIRTAHSISKIAKDKLVFDYIKTQLISESSLNRDLLSDPNWTNSLYVKAAEQLICNPNPQQTPRNTSTDSGADFGRVSKKTILEMIKFDSEIRKWLAIQTNESLGNKMEEIKREIKEKITVINTPTITTNGMARSLHMRKPSAKFVLMATRTTNTISSVPVLAEDDLSLGEQEIITLLNLQLTSENQKITKFICPPDLIPPPLTLTSTSQSALNQCLYIAIELKVHRMIFVQKRIEEKDVLYLLKMGNFYLKQNFYPPLCCIVVGSELAAAAQILMKKYKLQFVHYNQTL